MKLPITFAVVALLGAGVLAPTIAQAATSAESQRHVVRHDDHRKHDYSHRHRYVRTTRVYVPAHYVWRFGHRHWVPGHFEYRQVVYWR